MPLVRIDVNQGRSPEVCAESARGSTMRSWPSTAFQSATTSTSSPSTPAGRSLPRMRGSALSARPMS